MTTARLAPVAFAGSTLAAPLRVERPDDDRTAGKRAPVPARHALRTEVRESWLAWTAIASVVAALLYFAVRVVQFIAER